MPVTVSRKAHFNAAHRLHNRSWSDEQNRAVFGVCNNANYHGHNYELTVSVTGEIDPETGYVMDMKQLADLISEHVEVRFDHKNLNLDVPEFASLNPTAENIAVMIWNILRPTIKPSLALEVELQETPRNLVKYSGN